MRRILSLALAVLGAIAITASVADAGTVNTPNAYKWARDIDGDGIPNGLDPDWSPPADGTGYGHLGPFVGPTLFQGHRATVRSEVRWRNGAGSDNTKGDFLRIRLRIRDHTCR
jgi:hypothetical protein